MDASTLFDDFLADVIKPGKIDQRVKTLMAIALSIADRCAPCFKIHVKSAQDLGISKEEIDEAALLAVSFTGCTGKMFYQDMCAEMGL